MEVIHSSELIKCIGIELFRPVLQTLQPQHYQDNTIVKFQEFASVERNIGWESVPHCLGVALDIILQNFEPFSRKLIFCELYTQRPKNQYMNTIYGLMLQKPLHKARYLWISISDAQEKLDQEKIDVLIIEEPLSKDVLTFLNEGSFVLYNGWFKNNEELPLVVVDIIQYRYGTITLLRKIEEPLNSFELIEINNENFLWIDTLQTCIKEQKSKDICLLDQTNGYSGVIGLTDCLNKDVSDYKFRVIITDKKYEENTLFLENQLKKKLYYNVHNVGFWGIFKDRPLKIDKIHVEKAAMVIREVGTFSSWEWVQTRSTTSQ